MTSRSHRGRLVGNVAASVVVLWAMFVGLAATAPPAAADNGSPVNDAVAVNTKDGSSVFKLAFSVRSITNDTVAPENAAVAYASCSNCQTVAIAVQIVFVVGSPTEFTPTNEALAINDQCSMCDTLASAYQFVVQSSVPVRLTSDGKHQLHDIEKALRDLDGSGLTAMELQAKVDELMSRLAEVLATEVEPIPGKAKEGDTADSSASSSPSTTVTTSTTSTTSTSTTTASTTTTTTTTESSTTSTTSTTAPTTTSSTP